MKAKEYMFSPKRSLRFEKYIVLLVSVMTTFNLIYRAFHRFGQAKIAYGGLVLGLSQFSILPQLPPKIMPNSNLVKFDPKIIISLR